MDEARLKEVLHECFAELINTLTIVGTHNLYNVQEMSDRIHAKIEGLTDPPEHGTLSTV